nr:diguanylate cyclase [Aquibacillus kalidii]
MLENKHIYAALIILIGTILFFMMVDFEFSLSDWVLIYALVASTLVVDHYRIQLPPEGNFLSMDSAIYLATLFVFGLDFTLVVLLLSSIIHFIYFREDFWWISPFNFSLYAIMIGMAHFAYLSVGGTIGEVRIENVLGYVFSLGIYFLINLFLMAIFIYLMKKTGLIDALKGVLIGAFESYLCTLLLSIVLSFLVNMAPFMGLFLFVCIALLLSFTFKQHFELYQKVADKANKDHLTGLNNHGYFKEELAKTILEIKQSKEPLSLAMLDIDDFKKYNDTNGHLKGDNLLTFFGQQLERECVANQHIVARYGGEEFVILMKRTNELDAAHFIDSLRKKINDTYYEGVEILPYGCLSFSAGVIEWNSEIQSSSEFLSHADQAMYYAKAQGKNNTHVYGKEIEAISIEEPMEEMEQQLKIFLARDIYTYRHSKRVFKYAVEFSKLLDLKDYERKVLMLGALIHDIGKLEVPREIISKKGKLTKEEWELVKNHVTWGKQIVELHDKNKDISPLVELHHERYDGKGYPHGLKGEEIPKLARILCIIDSFDAMTTERPYQKTKTFQEAIVELRACAGTQFDPYFVEGFIDYIEKNYISVETVDTV